MYISWNKKYDISGINRPTKWSLGYFLSQTLILFHTKLITNMDKIKPVLDYFNSTR